MKILIFGSYDPAYSRNHVLLKGLRENGVEVIECNTRGSNLTKLLSLLFKYVTGNYSYDVMLVPFPGQEVMLLARCLTSKPIVFDAFTSHYGGYILDREKYSKNSLRAAWYKWLDRTSCKRADLVLLDTNAHIDFFVDAFELPRPLFKKLYVGTNSEVMKPLGTRPENSIFTVHFYGNYIPLQGVEYIIKAAAILRNEEIVFNIIGRGQTFSQNKRLADSLGLANVRFIEKVPYAELAIFINASDVCLGIFGHTTKAALVIPNKVYDALACSRAVITARTSAIEELLQDQEHAILCRPADPEDLAAKILLLKNDRELRNRVAKTGHELFLKELTEQHLGSQLLSYIRELL